ncbi:MAG: hypothetical protein HZA34_02300 [Candidatus Pacebacteria bacterium]|nr:hypothetical protein [Candidatus Paceibacterota bacterium]
MSLCPTHEARRNGGKLEFPKSSFQKAIESVAFPIIASGKTITKREAWAIYADIHPKEAAEMLAEVQRTRAAAESGQR